MQLSKPLDPPKKKTKKKKTKKNKQIKKNKLGTDL